MSVTDADRLRSDGLFTDQQKRLLAKHGYEPAALPRGVTGRPEVTFRTRDGILLRNRVCELEGVIIDGHERSDLDPASTSCIHCDYEGDHP